MNKKLEAFIIFLHQELEVNYSTLFELWNESLKYRVKLNRKKFKKEKYNEWKQDKSIKNYNSQSKLEWDQLSDNLKMNYKFLQLKSEKTSNPYILFFKAHHMDLKEKNPSMAFTELRSLISNLWKQEKEKKLASINSSINTSINTSIVVESVSNNDTNDNMLAINDNMLAINDDMLAINDNMLAINDNMLAINDDMLAINDDMLAINDDMLAINDDMLAINDDMLAINDDMLTTNDDMLAINDDMLATNEDMLTINDTDNDNMSTTNDNMSTTNDNMSTTNDNILIANNTNNDITINNNLNNDNHNKNDDNKNDEEMNDLNNDSLVEKIKFTASDRANDVNLCKNISSDRFQEDTESNDYDWDDLSSIFEDEEVITPEQLKYYYNTKSIYLLENETDISREEENKRVQDIQNFFNVDLLCSKNPIKLNYSEEIIKQFDPFISFEEKKKVQGYVDKLSIDDIKRRLTKIHRWTLPKSSKLITKPFLQKYIYIFERNDRIIVSFEEKKQFLPKRLTTLDDSLCQQLDKKKGELLNSEYWHIYRLYRKHLERDPKKKTLEEMVDKIIIYYWKQCEIEHIQKRMGIFREPQDEFGEWGQDNDNLEMKNEN